MIPGRWAGVDQEGREGGSWWAKAAKPGSPRFSSQRCAVRCFMASNRLFQIIVLGGIGLVAAEACGSTVETQGNAASGVGGAGGAGGSGGTGAGDVGGFPQEGPASGTTSSGMGGFPQEGPIMFDAGFDPPDADAGFPQ